MALRDLILWFMPMPMKAEAEDESRRWIATCPRCQEQFSVWDTGGMRYKATAMRGVTLVRCPKCARNSFVRSERKNEPASTAS